MLSPHRLRPDLVEAFGTGSEYKFLMVLSSPNLYGLAPLILQYINTPPA